MQQETFRKNWTNIQHDAFMRWTRLSDADLSYINGHQDRMVRAMMHKYRWSEEKAQQEIDYYYT